MNKNEKLRTCVLNDFCKGFAEKKDNCWNYSIYANDSSVDVLTNEYYAGFIQAKLQGCRTIMAARNNVWNNAFLTDTSAPSDKFPKEFDPNADELRKAAKCLKENYCYLFTWIKANETDAVARNIKRLMFRMLGISDGCLYDEVKTDVSMDRLDPNKMNQLCFELGYNIQVPSFADIYLINAQSDMFDAISTSKEARRWLHKSDHCSAFLKRTDNDIYWTHNSWCGFLCQSHTISYYICGDFVTQNSYCQGQFGSNMDFGFNKNGICFNETTHRCSYNKPKVKGIWICWRAAAAEMFAKDIDDFYRHMTVDNTGTYLNGYMIIDTKTNETALLEMSYKRFVLFRSDGKTLKATDSRGKRVTEKDYDKHLITPQYILGVNYPVSKAVTYDLESTDNRPMRRVQFFDRIESICDMETTKSLITYVDNNNPLSIYGRWDLGKGITEYPKTIPDGAVDAKAYSANAVKSLLSNLNFIPNEKSDKTSFWMKYGTAKIDGKAFDWNTSQWGNFKKSQSVDEVPNVLDG